LRTKPQPIHGLHVFAMSALDEQICDGHEDPFPHRSDAMRARCDQIVTGAVFSCEDLAAGRPRPLETMGARCFKEQIVNS
jgi:hypothetical protein